MHAKIEKAKRKEKKMSMQMRNVQTHANMSCCKISSALKLSTSSVCARKSTTRDSDDPASGSTGHAFPNNRAKSSSTTPPTSVPSTTAVDDDDSDEEARKASIDDQNAAISPATSVVASFKLPPPLSSSAITITVCCCWEPTGSSDENEPR